MIQGLMHALAEVWHRIKIFQPVINRPGTAEDIGIYQGLRDLEKWLTKEIDAEIDRVAEMRSEKRVLSPSSFDKEKQDISFPKNSGA